MPFTVRPAKDQESSFGWPMYGALISSHIFPLSKTTQDKADWMDGEEVKFHENWKKNGALIIEDSNSAIGWASIQKCNNRVTVHNIFVGRGYKLADVGAEILKDLVAEWKAGNRVVEIPVLMSSPEVAEIKTALKGLGFSEGGDDGMVVMMIADWSK